MRVFLEVVKCFGLFFMGIIFSEYYNCRIRKSYREGRKDSVTYAGRK